MNDILIDTCIVIRSVGERTGQVCFDLVSRAFPDNHIYFITEYPFENAIEKCFDIAQSDNAKYLITLDADLIPNVGNLKGLLLFAAKQRSDVVVTTGLVHDKFLQRRKKAANHIYSGHFLPSLLESVPAYGQHTRPESAAIAATMKHKKLKRKTAPIMVGLHDHEQFYRDIYRTYFLHARKRRAEVLKMLPKWESMVSTDSDFAVAIRAVIDSVTLPIDVSADARIYQKYVADTLRCLGIFEKDALDTVDAVDLLEDSAYKEKNFSMRKLLNFIR